MIQEETESNDDYHNRLRQRSNVKPPSRYDDYVNIDECFISEGCEPLNYKEAIKCNESEKCTDAMNEEMESLSKNQVWELVNSPTNANLMGNRWVYKAKKDAEGNIVRYKARLVVKGVQGIDYTETFSPVIRYNSIKLILAIAAKEKLLIKQFDIKTAFLNSRIDKDIYMKQPEGFSNNTNQVCKLQKSIYGLKQSSRCWNEKFTDFLIKMGLKPSDADPCIFINRYGTVILGIYVDDGIILAKYQMDVENLIKALKEAFEITIDNTNTFLGLKIEKQEDGSLFLHQAAYAKKLIDRFRMHAANPVTIPANPSQQLGSNNQQNRSEIVNVPYREAVGSLLYLSNGTRPDLTYAVNKASRYLENPTKQHWNAVKRILKYTKGTINYRLKF